MWRDEHGAQRSRTFPLKRDADAYEAKAKLAKRQGELADLDAGRETLKSFAGEWWRLYVEQNLAATTRVSYAGVRDRYILPKLGHLPLRSITPQRVQRFQTELAEADVGAPTIRRALAILQGMLERAVEWGRIQRNPVRSVRKPRQKRTRVIEPLSPRQVEAVRSQMGKRKWHRDATLVSVLAYAGLRPGEALALRWSDVRERTIIVDKALALGDVKATKTQQSRTVRLMRPLAKDLKEWRKAAGNPESDKLIFPTRDGEPWGDSDYRNWRKRRFTVAATAASLGTVRPYDLRHSFASLLIAEQTNPAEIAGQLGHSLQTLFTTYAHVIEDLRGGAKLPAERQITRARTKSSVARKLPKAKSTRARRRAISTKNPA